MEKLHITLGAGSDVLIGEELLPELSERLAVLKPRGKVMLVCDDTVASLYAKKTEDILRAGGYAVNCVIFPAGERSKTMDMAMQILELMGEEGYTRTDTVLALGGGVTSDLAGFAASIYARGVDTVYIPTTLLACVDAAIGGKTGIDLACGKNMAGSFWQPRFVLCDCTLLRSLPEKEFSGGMAEVIKYALAFDAEFFEYLETVSRSEMDLPKIISRCCKWKIQCVEQDERDTGIRRLLNLGHTVGHAIELLSDYGVPHGCAVSIGLCRMCRSAEGFGLCEKGTTERVEALCRRFGLPTETEYSTDDLFSAAAADKKRSADHITLAIPKGIGSAERMELPFAELRLWIERGQKR